MLIKTSMAFDQKWRSKMNYHQMRRNHKLFDLATLRNLPDFSLQNQVHSTREHPYSWRLRLYVDNPIPPENAEQAQAFKGGRASDSGYVIQMPRGSRSSRVLETSSPIPPGADAAVRRTTSAGVAPASISSSGCINRDPVPIHVESAASVRFQWFDGYTIANNPFCSYPKAVRNCHLRSRCTIKTASTIQSRSHQIRQ